MRKIVKNINNDNAITLIALVVTIIILLILAGVTVGLATNGTGLFEKAKLATDEYNNKVQQEKIELEKTVNNINEVVNSRDGTNPSITLGTLLWEGTWTDDSITVPGISNYTMCIAVAGIYSAIFSVQSGVISLQSAGYESNSTRTYFLNKLYTISNDTLTTTNGSSYQIYNSSTSWAAASVIGVQRKTDSIQKIYGLF